MMTSPRMMVSPPLNPQVEDVVKVNIGQKRTDTTSLRCPFFLAYPLPLFQHTGFQPFPDKPNNAPVCNTVLDKRDQPFVTEGIKEGTKISIEHPTHLFLEFDDCSNAVSQDVMKHLRCSSDSMGLSKPCPRMASRFPSRSMNATQ